MHYVALGFAEMYKLTRTLPRWLLYIITGAIGSIVIQFLHKGETKKLEEKGKTSKTKSSSFIPSVLPCWAWDEGIDEDVDVGVEEE